MLTVVVVKHVGTQGGKSSPDVFLKVSSVFTINGVRVFHGCLRVQG